MYAPCCTCSELDKKTQDGNQLSPAIEQSSPQKQLHTCHMQEQAPRALWCSRVHCQMQDCVLWALITWCLK